MRMRFSRSITWGQRKRVCKRVRVFVLIYTWDGKGQTWVMIYKVIIVLEFFIRFGLLLKGNPFCSE